MTKNPTKKKKKASCTHWAHAMKLVFINDILPFPYEILIYTQYIYIYIYVCVCVCVCVYLKKIYVYLCLFWISEQFLESFYEKKKKVTNFLTIFSNFHISGIKIFLKLIINKCSKVSLLFEPLK